MQLINVIGDSNVHAAVLSLSMYYIVPAVPFYEHLAAVSLVAGSCSWSYRDRGREGRDAIHFIHGLLTPEAT